MFAYIKGILTAATMQSTVIEANGIGYLVSIPVNAFGQLPSTGSPVQLYTSYVVREQSQALYGFCSVQERDLFELLLGVSGVGPKLALSLIGHIALPDLAYAIKERDIPTLCKIPGVGKKTAERLIIELKDKLSHVTSSNLQLGMAFPKINDPKTAKIQDAMSALINLGYNQLSAQKVIKKSLEDLPEETSLATLLTHCLKNI